MFNVFRGNSRLRKEIIMLSKEWKEAVYNWWILIIPFIMMFSLLRVSPMMYDGWAGPYYYKQHGGIINWVYYVSGPLRDWSNGRVISNLLSGILESFTSEIPLDLVGALVLTGILYCILYLFKVKNKLAVTVLYTSMLVLIPCSVRTYVLQIALVAYIPPILFVLIELILLDKYTKENDTSSIGWLYPLSIASCMWMENTSVAYGVVLFSYAVSYTYKIKKFDWKLWGTVITALLSGLFMMSSQGMARSRIEPVPDIFLEFSRTRLFEHLSNIFSGLIRNSSMAHITLGLVLLSVCLCRISYNKNKKSAIALWSLFFVNVFAVVIFCDLGLKTGEFNYNAEIDKESVSFIIQNNKLLLFCLVGYVLWLLVNLIVLCKIEKNIIYICLYGISLLVVLFPTNQIGVRIYSPICFVVIILGCYILSQNTLLNVGKNLVKKIYVVVLILCFVLALDFQSQLCLHINTIQKERDEIIQLIRNSQLLGIEKENNVYTLPLFSERDMYYRGETTIGTFHYPQFLQRVGLNKDTKILFSNSMDLQITEYSIKENGLNVSFINKRDGTFLYDYIVSYQNGTEFIDYVKKEGMSDTSYFAEASFGRGNYRLTIVALNEETGERILREIYWVK